MDQEQLHTWQGEIDAIRAVAGRAQETVNHAAVMTRRGEPVSILWLIGELRARLDEIDSLCQASELFCWAPTAEVPQ